MQDHDHPLRLFLDRIRAQGCEKIDVRLPPDFIDLHEEELVFADPITVEGEVYLAGEEVVIALRAETVIRMPCAICNAPVALPLQNAWTSVEPVDSFRHGVIDLREMVRENLLIEVPLVAECEPGNCPERKVLAPYLRQEQEEREETGFHPFADLRSPDE